MNTFHKPTGTQNTHQFNICNILISFTRLLWWQ